MRPHVRRRRGSVRGEAGTAGWSPSPVDVVAGSDVLVAGLFSAKFRGHAEAMEELAARVADLGGRVAASFVQRRGISGGRKGNAPGGLLNMDRPYSRRTLMSAGKVGEIASARVLHRARAVIFYNDLTDHQRGVLSDLFECPVFSRHDL